MGFELAAVVQFVTWLLCHNIIPYQHLYLLPTSREIFDIIFIKANIKSFGKRYQMFIYGHHTCSLFSRSVYSLMLRFLLTDNQSVALGELYMFYYYLCSIFLVSIKPMDFLFSKNNRSRFIIWLTLFSLARISHLTVYFVFCLLSPQLLLTIFITFGLFIQEGHSVFNSLPQLLHLYNKCYDS